MNAKRFSMVVTAAILLASPLCGKDDEEPVASHEVEITGPGQSIEITNPFPPDQPTIYVVGVPDTAASPPRLTRGVALQGCRLSERLLSESVLIVRPDGTGNWGYYPGFDVFRLPSERPPREGVEYGKYRYDPLFLPRVVGNDINMLSLRPLKGNSAVVYEIAFPPSIKINTLKVTSSTSGFTEGRIAVALFRDRALTESIKTAETDASEAKSINAVFHPQGMSRVFLSLGASDCKHAWPYLYRTTFEAELDTTGVRIPVLETGDNTWVYTDDEESSHRARILLRWLPRPPAERIWDDFERESGWEAQELQAEITDVPPRPFTGRRYARLSFVVAGRRPAYVRKIGGEDFSSYTYLAIAHRQPKGLRCGLIWVEIVNRDGTVSRFKLGREQRWQFAEFDISNCSRDAVESVGVRFLDTHWRWRKGDEFVFDIDTLCFYRDERPKKPPPPEYPPHVANYVSPFRDAPLGKRRLPPVHDWFPMGLYTGPCPSPVSEFILDDMRRHHMNTWYISNGNLDFARRVVDEAERRGMRIIYQGTSAPALYYIHYDSAAQRRSMFHGQLAPSAKQFIPAMRGRWGLLAWSLTEEIKPEVVDDIADYYALVRELDPTHPPTVLHNNIAAAERDFEVNRPAVVTYDFYPFFWNPRSGPSTPQRSLSMLRDRLDKFYVPARKVGASLWLMPQVHGSIRREPLAPPGYGYLTGYRPPTLEEVAQQAWIGIAHGVTGIMYYTYRAREPDFVTFRDYNWHATPRLSAVSELFQTLKRIAPLLCRIERDFRDAKFFRCENGNVVCHTFIKRAGFPGKARYALVANLDGFGPQSFSFSQLPDARVFDMITRTEVAPSSFPIELPPGWGGLYLIGHPEDFMADVKMIDDLLQAYYP